MKHSAITRTISDIKIPNWLILETMSYGYGNNISSLLIYISIMSRMTLMMDGWYKATLSVDDIANDWDFDEFSINYFGYIKPMDKYIDDFNKLIRKRILMKIYVTYDGNKKFYTYNIKAIHGSFPKKTKWIGSNVYLLDDEVRELMAYKKPRRECAFLVLCFIRFMMPEITDEKAMTAVIGKSTLVNNCHIGVPRVEYTVDLLKNMKMIDFYQVCERDESGKRIKSELFGNGYVPVYTIPGLADEKDAYDCAVEFLKRQNEHKHY